MFTKRELQNCEDCANRKVGHYQEWEGSQHQLVVAVVEAMPLTRSLLHPFSPLKLLQPLSRTRGDGAITACFWRTQMERTELYVNLPKLINVVCCTQRNFLLSADPHAGLTGHLQEQGLKEGNYSLTRKTALEEVSQYLEGRGGGQATKIRNKSADGFITPMGQLPSQNGMLY